MTNFVIQKKYLSIHSEDRDVSKWPNANFFAIHTPIEYKNVVSLRLADINVPNIYVFSKHNHNLSMEIDDVMITISEGTYTGPQLAVELAGRLNIDVQYDPTSMKFIFMNGTSFTLDFTPSYLGKFLGFENQLYKSTLGNINYQIPITNNSIISNTSSITGDSYIYMELDLFNSMDEIKIKTSNHNCSFAKIPTHKPYVSKENYLSNLFFSDPPLERIQKLQFKFRYHNGQLIDFGNQQFSFTMEVTMLRPDSIKSSIQIHPNYYTLT
jgi:hypothetical protein